MGLETEESGQGVFFFHELPVQGRHWAGPPSWYSVFQGWVGSQGSQSEAGVAVGLYQNFWPQKWLRFHYMSGWQTWVWG